jgi:hypothetical protein
MHVIVFRDRGSENWRVCGVLELPEMALVAVKSLRAAFPKYEFEAALTIEELPK